MIVKWTAPLTAILLCCGASAQQPPAPAAAPATPEAVKPKPVPAEKVVCRSHTEVGSHLSSSRECHTVSEWDRLARQDQSSIRNAANATRMGRNPE